VPGGRAGRPWAAALEAIAGYDRSDRVAAIGVPVMLIAAELDPVSTQRPCPPSPAACRRPA
jgi:alpha-beta hydrolase superfamily lysophospholipase